MHRKPNPISGHVFVVQRKKGEVWFSKYRLPDGRHVKKRLREKADGWNRRRAEAALQEILVEARRGTLPGLVKTRVTFKDAANEWLRHGEVERGIKPSTHRDYKSAVNRHLIPAFGDMKIEDVTTKTIERWRARQVTDGKLPRRTANKLVAILHGIFERARDEYELEIKTRRSLARVRERFVATRRAWIRLSVD